MKKFLIPGAAAMLIASPAFAQQKPTMDHIMKELEALSGRVDAVAGREAGTNFYAFQAYVPARRRWVSLPKVPETRGGTDSASVGPLLVSAGSESPAGTSAAVYAFDLRTRRWRRLPDLPTARHGLGVLGLGGRVYVIGGGPTPGLSVSGANEYLQLR